MTYDLDHIESAAQAVVDALGGGGGVVAFYGPMGAGKTTLIRAVCRLLGSEDNVASPTFAIVNQYVGADGRTINHFDFYRIAKLSEAFDLGYEEYFYGDGLCLVEWPERIEALLPGGHLRVSLEILGERERKLTISK